MAVHWKRCFAVGEIKSLHRFQQLSRFTQQCVNLPSLGERILDRRAGLSAP
jgi:hypothetical protein